MTLSFLQYQASGEKNKTKTKNKNKLAKLKTILLLEEFLRFWHKMKPPLFLILMTNIPSEITLLCEDT